MRDALFCFTKFFAMKAKISIQSDLSHLAEGIEFVEDTLKKCGCKPKDVSKTLLMTEELLVLLFQKTEPSKKIFITVSKFLGTVKVVLVAEGSELIASELSIAKADFFEDDMGPDAENVIRKIVLNSQRDKFSFAYRNGVNRIQMIASQSSQKNLIYALCAFLAAFAIGVPLRMFLPSNVVDSVDNYLFDPIKTAFMHALKMVMIPMIFFSIASCIASFKDLRKLGRIGGKVMGFYAFTTTIAVALGFLFYRIFDPGTFGEMISMSIGERVQTADAVSVKDTFVGIVPSNLVQAFANADTLQIIFLAILIGTAAGMLGNRSERMSELLSDANELFLKVASIITKFLPLMIFAAMASLISTVDIGVMKSLFSFVVSLIVANIAMLIAYLVIVLIFAKVNPLWYFKNAFSAWLNAFAISSSNAVMPYTMEVCDKKLRISSRIYSLSIPLGATINMDGLSIVLIISSLFFANAFGITLSPTDIASLIFTVVVLSLSCPGIPGGGIICMSVLLKQCGVPLEALGVFVGVHSLTDPIITANNVFGDMTGTYIVARRNGMMQKDENSKS